MARNRNKYKMAPVLSALPNHVIEQIISMSTVETQARCRQLCKALYDIIGDVRPVHVIHQMYFVELLRCLCEDWRCYYFNMRVSSKKYHIIVSHEEHDNIYMHVIKKGYGQKAIIRTFKRLHTAKNINNLFKRGTCFKGCDMASKTFFAEVFADVNLVSLSCGDKEPLPYTNWKCYISRKYT